jgi:radical SAM protein with 4Fe4S-binding SPASM domain
MARCYTIYMRYYLARGAALKWLETPFVYQIIDDELYELDSDSFRFMRNCSSREGCISKDGAFIDYCMDEGLLTAEMVSVQRPPLTQAPEPSLRYLELQITDACNLRCRHCYINNNTGHEISPIQVRAIMSDFEEMQGLRLLITGGEPLLHHEFDQINEMLPDFAFRKVLFTNGVLLSKERLKNLNVHEIQVSIDGLEHAHDKTRGAGSFKSAMEAVKLSLDAGMAVSVSTMVHRENLSDFDSMERLFKNIGIKDWTVDIPCSAGRLREHSELHVTPEEGSQYLGYGYGGGIHSSTQGYGCGLHLMAVLADGTMAKCAFYKDKTVGTVDDGLRTAWQKVQPVRLKDLSCNCAYLEVCRGGCRYRAELLEGKGGKDLYRCRFYGIL